MHFHQVFTDFVQTTSWWHTLTELLGAPWLQNLILAVTAAIGLYTLGASSRQERRRATVDVLLELLHDKEFLETRAKVKALIDAGLDIPALLSKEGIDNRRLLLSILSRYEFMASGLREGAFDEGIYQRMYYTTIVTDWASLQAFIFALRKQRNLQTPYQELQQLVLRWQKHPLKPYAELPTRLSQLVSRIKSYLKLSRMVSQTVSLTIPAPENSTFALSALPTSASVAPGSTANSTITTIPSGGFDSSVALTASGQPEGVNVTFTPTSVDAPGAGSSKMTIAVAPTAPPGTYSITVTGNPAADPAANPEVGPHASPTQAPPAIVDASAPAQTPLKPPEPHAPSQSAEPHSSSQNQPHSPEKNTDPA
jgi:hypothetical protein